MTQHPATPPVRDPVAHAHELERVHEAVLSGSPAPRPPRSVILSSWQRSLRASIDPDGWLPELVYEGGELEEARAQHPLSGVLPLLRQTLVSIADEAMHIMIITDAAGHILWREGNAQVRGRADDVLLTEGTRWSEDSIGTNAMGTTLAVDRPVQIYSAEHLVRTYHEWTCAAAPVHDPDTGAVLGSIDISGPLHTVHPATLALVSTAAQLVDKQLHAQQAAEDDRVRTKNLRYLSDRHGALVSPSGRLLTALPAEAGGQPSRVDITRTGTIELPDGATATLEPLDEGFLLQLSRDHGRGTARRTGLELRALRQEHPTAHLDGRTIPLTLRHAEILAMLAMHPQGMTGEQLACALYGDDGNPVTVRAEIHRLRATLGASILRTKPYRLDTEIYADFVRVREAIGQGRLEEAVSLYGTTLLERSEAPEIRGERDELHAALRGALLSRNDPELLWSFTRNGRDDLEIYQRLRDLLPFSDPRLPIVQAHLDNLLAD